MATFRLIIMLTVGAYLLATMKTTEGGTLSHRLNILRAGMKELQKETSTCPKYCNKYYSQCKNFVELLLEKEICTKATIICHFGCTGKNDDSKRKLLLKMSRLIPTQKKVSKVGGKELKIKSFKI